MMDANPNVTLVAHLDFFLIRELYLIQCFNIDLIQKKLENP